MVITPFQTTSGNTALISAVLHDAIGVVRDLVQALSWLGINIEVQESSSIDHLALHRVGMIVDLGTWRRSIKSSDRTPERVKRMYRPYAANVPIHSRRYLQLFDMIVAQCGRSLCWQQYEGCSIPLLYVRPLPRRDELNTSSVTLKAAPDGRYTEIKLPTPVGKYIRGRLEVPKDEREELHYVFMSDTNDRALRTFFLPRERAQRLVHVGIHHSDVPGTLGRVLDVVAIAEFNVITSLLRKYSEDTSVWEAIIEYRGVGDVPVMPGSADSVAEWYRTELIPWVHERLSESPRLSDIRGCEVAIGPPLYPKHFGGADPKNRRTLSARGKRTPTPFAVTNGTVMELLEQQITDFTDTKHNPDDHRATEKLLNTVLLNRQRIRRRTLFLSYPESAKTLIGYLRPELLPPREPSYHLTQFQESRPPDFQEQIIKLIRDADYFLAIWHPDNDRDGHRIRGPQMSPWMFFEYGMARAAGKPVVVACHDEFETIDLRRLVGNTGVVRYNDADFAPKKVDEIRDICADVFKDGDEALFNDEIVDEPGT